MQRVKCFPPLIALHRNSDTNSRVMAHFRRRSMTKKEEEKKKRPG